MRLIAGGANCSTDGGCGAFAGTGKASAFPCGCVVGLAVPSPFSFLFGVAAISVLVFSFNSFRNF